VFFVVALLDLVGPASTQGNCWARVIVLLFAMYVLLIMCVCLRAFTFSARECSCGMIVLHLCERIGSMTCVWTFKQE
jgi:hypothetical protein